MLEHQAEIKQKVIKTKEESLTTEKLVGPLAMEETGLFSMDEKKSISLTSEIEKEMPHAMGEHEAEALYKNRDEVMLRSDVGKNMPESHLSISQAKERFFSNKKMFGDSAKMKLVKDKTANLLNLLDEKVLSPCGEADFTENLLEVEKGYNELITSCKLYIEKAKNPFTPKGKRRLNIVKDILLSAQMEKKMIADAAGLLRSRGRQKGDNTIITFSDIIPHMRVRAEEELEGTIFEVNETSERKVLVSRFAQALGTGEVAEKADLRTCRGKEGLKDVVVLSQETPQSKNTADILNAILDGVSEDKMKALLKSVKESKEKANRDTLNALLTMDPENILLSFGSVFDPKNAEKFFKALKTFKNCVVTTGLDKELDLFVSTGENEFVVSYFTEEEKSAQFAGQGIKVTEGEAGLLKEGTDEETEYIIDHTIEEPYLDQETKEDNAWKWEDKKDEPLFSNEPNINDVIQGSLGDCYFIAAIASVVQHDPGAIKKMMRDNKDGTVTVRLFQFEGGQKPKLSPIYVKIKKSIPLIKGHGEDFHDPYATGSLWVQLLEKAMVCSGLCRGMDNILEEINKGNLREDASMDLRDPAFMKYVKDIRPMKSVKERKKEKRPKPQTGGYQELGSGGLPAVVLPLLTGAFLSDMNVRSSNLYWKDSGFAPKEKNSAPAFKNLLNVKDQKAGEYLMGLMKQHDEKKKEEVTLKNKKIREHNEKVGKLTHEERKKQKLSKKREIVYKSRYNLSHADDNEKKLGRFFMYTGVAVSPEMEKDNEIMERVDTCLSFVKGFMEFMDEKVSLKEKNRQPKDGYVKLLKDFSKSFGEKEKAKKKFTDSEYYLRTCQWIMKVMKNPENEKTARYTHYSGNYYGKALSVYDNISKGSEEGRVMTLAFDERITLTGKKKSVMSGEVNTGGLYGYHAYTITGVTERKFGGKTYKFVVIRNPWGYDGTEYYYNPKTKSLKRRQAKNKKDTGGYTMMELSEFMMLGEDVFIQDKKGGHEA